MQGHRQEFKDAKDRHSDSLSFTKKSEIFEFSDGPDFLAIGISLALVAFDPLGLYVPESRQVQHHSQVRQFVLGLCTKPDMLCSYN